MVDEAHAGRAEKRGRGRDLGRVLEDVEFGEDVEFEAVELSLYGRSSA